MLAIPSAHSNPAYRCALRCACTRNASASAANTQAEPTNAQPNVKNIFCVERERAAGPEGRGEEKEEKYE